MKATITNPAILIKPSRQLISHINSLKKCSDMPSAFINIRLRKPKACESLKPTNSSDLLADSDREFVKGLDLPTVELTMEDAEMKIGKNQLLCLDDLIWLWNKINEKDVGDQPYLHELLMGSEIILPQNAEIPRNEELDKRCNMLKAQQENRQYKAMTKNVDNVRKKLPEETIAYQIKQINRQLIAVGQFIISVLAGFAFGFLGVELMVGRLDFGFRLLLGVICSLTIALAELYFLAKKLNEDLQYEVSIENKTAHAKID